MSLMDSVLLIQAARKMGNTTFLVKYFMKNVTAGMSQPNFLYLRIIGI